MVALDITITEDQPSETRKDDASDENAKRGLLEFSAASCCKDRLQPVATYPSLRSSSQDRTDSPVEWSKQHIVALSQTHLRYLVLSAELAGSTGATKAVTMHEFTLGATDGYPLAAELWTSNDSTPPSVAALVNAGAGIGSPYYRRFATFLAGANIPTVLYDYRGIGRSRPHSLRGFAASVEEWGSKDCAAALTWLEARFPAAKRLVIGHSVGGFVTGFVTNGRLIDLMLLIGAHTGYWRDYATRARPAMYLLWHTIMPALTHLFGYFPGRRLHLLEDLPAGIALEWANRRQPDFWWNLKTQAGEVDRLRVNEVIARFLDIRAPTLALRFVDDVFATEAATTRVLALYKNCWPTQIVLGPQDVGGQKIGHFGFFRSRFRETLWPRVTDWIRVGETAE